MSADPNLEIDLRRAVAEENDLRCRARDARTGSRNQRRGGRRDLMRTVLAMLFVSGTSVFALFYAPEIKVKVAAVILLLLMASMAVSLSRKLIGAAPPAIKKRPFLAPCPRCATITPLSFEGALRCARCNVGIAPARLPLLLAEARERVAVAQRELLIAEQERR